MHEGYPHLALDINAVRVEATMIYTFPTQTALDEALSSMEVSGLFTDLQTDIPNLKITCNYLQEA